MAVRALAISRRSMVLTKRPNKVVEGVRPIEAVLDILIPWLQYSGSLRFALGTDLRIPDARNNRLVCIAAYSILQCNIKGFRELLPWPGQTKGPPEPAALTCAGSAAAYSAANFRGGSSAPESWISATWWSVKPRTCRRISSVCSPSRGERVTSVGLSDILMGLPTEEYLSRSG